MVVACARFLSFYFCEWEQHLHSLACTPSSTNRTQRHGHHHNPDHRIIELTCARPTTCLFLSKAAATVQADNPPNPSSLTTPCNCRGRARDSLHVIFVVIVKDIQVPWSVVNLLNNIFRCSLPHAVLFCIAQSLLLLPSTHIGRGRRWWAVQGTHLEFFPQVPPKTCIIGFFGVSAEVAVKAWNQMEELICSPHLPNFNITAGHLHLCVPTPPMTPLSWDYWGGKTQRLFTSTCGHTLRHLLN